MKKRKMTQTGLQRFDKTVQKSNSWLNELSKEIGIKDKHETYLILKAVIKAIRDRLTIDEAAHFASQLPALLRGHYYESWKPSLNPRKMRHIEDFLRFVEEKYGGTQKHNYKELVPKVINFLSKQVTEGEIEDIKSIMPPELKEFWEISEKINP